MVSKAFAVLLRDGRDQLNARFNAARHRYPDLDAVRFRSFLESAVDPLVVAMDERFPAATPALLYAAWDTALELCGQRLVGADSRFPAMNTLWHEVLPSALPLLAREPARLLAATGNATHQLASTPGARPLDWLTAMRAGVSHCADGDTWLRLGQVLAWRSGLSHYRDTALTVADALPSPLLTVALGVPHEQWPALKDRLLRDPWWQPGQRAPMEEVRRIGGFSGFGGPFRQLPRVDAVDDKLFISSGDDCWLLVADRHGSTLHRATPEEHQAVRSRKPALPDVRGNRVSWRGHTLALEDLGSISSHAANAHTLLVCSPDSFEVVVVALAGTPP